MTPLEERLANQRPRRKWRTALLALLGLLIFAAASAASYIWFGGSADTPKTVTSLLGMNKKVNVMVMGVDSRADDAGRSDTLFVMTLDTGTKQVSMMSIPRDTRVKMPGHGWDKINHAYAYGGHDLTKRAVEDLLGIQMDYYVQIDIAGFQKVIDAIGGVTIDVEKRMYYEDPYDDNGGLVINLKPGVQHMNGKTAIQYVRYRDEEGDIGRVARQQKFIKAVLEEIASPGVIPRLPAIIKEVSSAIKTDMSVGDMLSYGKMVNDARKQGLNTYTVPGKPAYIGEVSYWLPDVVELREQVAQIQGSKTDDRFMATAKKVSSEYETNVPKEARVVEAEKVNSTGKLVNKPIEAPKPGEKPTAPGQPNNPAGAKAPDNPSKPGVNKPSVPDRVRVTVVNASGINGAGAQVASALRGQGMDIAGVMTADSPSASTVVTAHTASNAVIGKLSGLPFRYVLQIANDDSRADQVTVVIGKDYGQ